MPQPFWRFAHPQHTSNPLPCHGRDVHDELVSLGSGELRALPYDALAPRVAAQQHDPYAVGVVRVRVRGLPGEHMQAPAGVERAVAAVVAACSTAEWRLALVRVEDYDAHHFWADAAVRVSGSAAVAAGGGGALAVAVAQHMTQAVLCDRHTLVAAATPRGRALLFSYAQAVQRLPQGARHYKLDGLPYRYVVVTALP